MSWLLTMAMWTLFGGFYAAAWSFAITDLVRRTLEDQPVSAGAARTNSEGGSE